MRRLTDGDLAGIKGRTIQGYRVVAAKIRKGPFVDSGHHGVMLGKNTKNEYVTWEFYLKDGESVSVCRGHYMTDREEALRDFDTRSIGLTQWFDVTITETSQLTVRVEARSPAEAEQIVTDDWKRSEYVLGPENFAGVEFKASLVEQQEKCP